MLDLYKAIDSLRKINEGPNKMGPQEIAVGDRVEFEGEKFEVVDVELDTIVADNLKTGLRNRLNSKALFWINEILSFLFALTCFESWGSITTPIAIPAIAKFIWYILSA